MTLDFLDALSSPAKKEGYKWDRSASIHAGGRCPTTVSRPPGLVECYS